jgi:hypothetical protein
VILRTSANPPEDSHLYGIDLDNGTLRVDQPLPPSYDPSGDAGLPYDIRDGVVYLDACSGHRCCLFAVDLTAPVGPAGPQAATGGFGSATTTASAASSIWESGVFPVLWRQPLRRALAAAGLVTAVPADGPVTNLDPDPDDSASSRSFQFCFDVEQACRAKQARSIGMEVIYALLAAQMALLLVGFGSVVAWRLCCRRRYAPYTRLNSLPVVEVPQHDIASEEPDAEDDVDSEEGPGAGANSGGARAILAIDPQTGLAVPVVRVPLTAGTGTGTGSCAAAGAGSGAGVVAPGVKRVRHVPRVGVGRS